MGLNPQFDEATITAQLTQFAIEQEQKFIEGLAYIGETFVNKARTIRTYQDETGNLRSSIGYTIVKNGKVKTFNISSAATEGKMEAAEFVQSKVSEGTKDSIYLMVFAGMNYALYVEAHGYDIISGSRPSRSEILSTFKDLLE